MSFDRLHGLLQDMFSQVNISNHAPEPAALWGTHGEAIASLLASSVVREEFVAVGHDIWLPRSLEAIRALSQLRQRFEPTDRGRSLIGRIRAEAIMRSRPARVVPRTELQGELRTMAELTPRHFAQFAAFHLDGWKQVLATLRTRKSLIVTAPTGSGKTEVFLIPLVYHVAQALARQELEIPRYVLVYPRVALLKDQLIRVFRTVALAQRLIRRQLKATVLSQDHAIIIGMQFGGIMASTTNTLQNGDVFTRDGIFRIIERCPICSQGQLRIVGQSAHLAHVRCSEAGCDADYWLSLGRNDHAATMAHLLVTTAESLDRLCLDASNRYNRYLRMLSGIVLDEVHLYASLYGVHVANLLRRLEDRRGSQPLAKIAASATVSNPARFAAKLFHRSLELEVPVHSADAYPLDPAGLEIVYFLQSPDDAESHGPAPTLIQGIMALGHGVLDPQDRMLIFTESVDMAGRLEQQIGNAERARWHSGGVRRGLWEFRTRLDALAYAGAPCPGTEPYECSAIYAQGECWRGIRAGDRCCTAALSVREHALEVVQVTSQQPHRFWEGDVVVATSALEVGVDDERIRATIHYRPPRTVFSFLQRRGRAGRGTDDIAYTMLVLGNTPSDNFYFFRRNRLLHGSYELPLNPQNAVIQAMHDRLEDERKKMARHITAAGKIPQGIWRWICEQLRGCPLLMRLYGEKLTALEGRSLDGQRSLIKRWVTDERKTLESYLSLQWLLREIEDELPETLSAQAGEALARVDKYIHDHSSASQEEVGECLEALFTDLSRMGFRETNDEMRSHLKSLQERLERVWDAVLHQVHTIEPHYAEALYDFFQTLGRLFSEGWVINSSPDVLKIMLQAMFYLHLAIDTKDDRGCHTRMPYFIPDNYFQEVKPVLVEVRPFDGTDRKLDQIDANNLEALLIPYKPIYRYYPHPLLSIVDTMHATSWVSDVDAEGKRIVTIRLKADGVRRDGALYPQKIYIKALRSDDDGDQIVKICPSCFALHHVHRTRRCHEALVPVSLFAEAIVERKFTMSTQWRISSTMHFLERLHAATTLYGSTVEAKVMAWNPVSQRYDPTRRMFNFEARYQTPLQYDITSKGIAWDFSTIVAELLQDDELRKSVEAVTIPLQPQPVTKRLTADLVLHTAAHMLHRAVASVSGVNEQVLEYSWSGDGGQVAVWERFEGGAGISEVFAEALRTDPVGVYRELLSVILCPVQLAEGTPATESAQLAKLLAAEWHLAPDDEFLQETTREAWAEHTARVQRAHEEQQQVCLPPVGHDGCPACIHSTYCLRRHEQAPEVSRLVGEALLRALVRRVTRVETEMLMKQAIEGNYSAPALLDADPQTDTYYVLLL